MKIEDRPIESVIEYGRNPRRNDAAVSGVAASIKEFGWKQPIVVDKDSVVVAGHTRLKAARKLGLKFVPVVVADDLTPQQVKAFRILDNKVAEKAEWDDELLALELQEIDLDLEEFEVDFDGADDGPVDLADDEVPAVEKGPAVTKPGDLWLCGDHRVLCGDSTKAEDVARVMDGKRADLCLTDPPYCVGYENQEREPGRASRKQKGDSFGDHHTSRPFLCGLFEAIPADLVVMTFPMDRHFHDLAAATESWDLLYELVWVKDSQTFVLGKNFQQKHEPILVFRRKKGKSHFDVPADVTTVFECPRPKASPDHPTPKPIGLFIQLAQYCSPPNGIIFEPFHGSGTTLIAAHRLGRTCYGIEISPQYCDVICKRFYAETGIIPVKESGEQFPVDDRTENTET